MILGSHHTEESKRRIHNALMGIPGHPHTEEAKKRIGDAHRGKIISKEMRRKISKSNRNRIIMKETKRRTCLSLMGHIVSMSTRRKISKALRGLSRRPLSEEHKEKLSRIGKRRWQDSIYKEKQLKAIFAGLDISPNKPERRLRNGLNKMFPDEYKFVGDGRIFIGGKSPDFININSQKKIIELFGTFWHSKGYTGKTKKQEENQRISHFAEYGYRTLIIWQRELENIRRLKKKLIRFHEE